MPFGAHETMEVHECLLEKVNMITHFNIYAKEVKNPQLLDMIVRHQQEEIASYNEIVNITRGNNGFTPVPPNTNVVGANNQQIRYGMNNPPQFSPQSDANLSDREIAIAMLLCHKNAARNGTQAALEAADPNLRLALLNSAATCVNQAYEVFLFMNRQGLYQVPAFKNQTTEAIFNIYQPAGEQIMAQYGMQADQNMGQYGVQSEQNMGYNNQNNSQMSGNMRGNMNNNMNDNMNYNMNNNMNSNMNDNMNSNMNSNMNDNMNVGSPNSVLYGSGNNAVGASSPYQGSNYQGMMQQ
jgi:spore coat protein CotF